MATFDCHSCGAPLPDGTDILCASCSYDAADTAPAVPNLLGALSAAIERARDDRRATRKDY